MATTKPTANVRVTTPPEPGIGGWLLVFTLGQAASLAIAVWLIGAGMVTLVQSHFKDYLKMSVVLVVLIADVVVSIIGLKMILRRDPGTPRFYRILLPTVAAVATLEALAFRSAVYARPVFYCVIWFDYWWRAKRVRETFAPRPVVPTTRKTR